MAAFLMLLSTDHCELCDEALSMLFSMPELAGLELRVMDVATDDLLLNSHGERIPVLQLFTDRLELELDWPFDQAGVVRALRSLRPPGGDEAVV